MKSTPSKIKIISTTFFKNFRNGMSGNADVKKIRRKQFFRLRANLLNNKKRDIS